MSAVENMCRSNSKVLWGVEAIARRPRNATPAPCLRASPDNDQFGLRAFSLLGRALGAERRGLCAGAGLDERRSSLGEVVFFLRCRFTTSGGLISCSLGNRIDDDAVW